MADKREQCKSCKIGCSENIFQIKLNQSRIPFDKCFDYVPKQTNAEKIRNMDNAELAEFISSLVRNANDYLTSEGNWLIWLQSEAE